MSNPKEIDKSIATDIIIAEINSSRNDEQIDSISFTSEELQNTIRTEGFHTRLSSQSKYNSQIIKEKYVICNRGGKDKPKPCDTLATSSIKRKPNSNKIIYRCTTKIIFENVYGTTYYKVKKFFEMHNHPLESIEERPYTKTARNMSYFEKEFVVRASKAKIGPTMAHKIQAVLKGGYEYVGAKCMKFVTAWTSLRRLPILPLKDLEFRNVIQSLKKLDTLRFPEN
uniref:Protein FAR1-RELATED SEQUENCE n=1 Tax=Lactuca sativa TaxID=4236 RepID=A0A9R1UUF9_LACSA|nr:hypothetical protein LSAT_V11C800420530 [Lactuca sativa]